MNLGEFKKKSQEDRTTIQKKFVTGVKNLKYADFGKGSKNGMIFSGYTFDDSEKLTYEGV